MNSVPGEPATFDPCGAPINLPIHLPASLTMTSHQVPLSILELATLSTEALVLAFPVVTEELPPVLSLVSLFPV